jgi:ubiquinone/menaquinone biosynthesis C-methylase UbiE
MSLACRVYQILIDPLLHRLRIKVASLIPDDSSVVEIASGTGAQSLLLAKTGRRVVGVDINEIMTSCASKRANNLNLNNITYHTADGSNLHFIADKEFDFTTITLALHELDDELRIQILKEMQRISKHMIIVDYNAPLPKNISGWGSSHIEMLAGESHYAGFKNYEKRGGILAILNEIGFKIDNQYTAIDSAILILEVSSL